MYTIHLDEDQFDILNDVLTEYIEMRDPKDYDKPLHITFYEKVKQVYEELHHQASREKDPTIHLAQQLMDMYMNEGPWMQACHEYACKVLHLPLDLKEIPYGEDGTHEQLPWYNAYWALRVYRMKQILAHCE